MRAMKDSGIEWIGEIPEGWEVKKLKFYCKEKRIISEGRSFFIGLENVVSNDGKYITSETIIDGQQGIICDTGDIIYSKLRPYLSKVLLVEKDSYCSGEFIVFTSIPCPVFFKYMLLNSGFTNEINMSTFGAKMPRADINFVLNTYLPTPDLSVQQRIASYLDAKCSKIDSIVTRQQQLIEKLKEYKQSVITEAVTKGLNPDVPMKDSGIEWIGEIPEGWAITKAKYLGTIRSGDSITNDECKDTGLYEVYGGNGLIGYTNRFNINDIKLVIGRVGALCGNVRISSGRRFVSDNALIFSSFDDEIVDYLFYVFSAFRLNRLNTSNAQPLITGTKVLNIYMPCISKADAISISKYLKGKCSDIDKSILSRQQLITKLKDYKKSLIYETVTGKREVPNV